MQSERIENKNKVFSSDIVNGGQEHQNQLFDFFLSDGFCNYLRISISKISINYFSLCTQKVWFSKQKD